MSENYLKRELYDLVGSDKSIFEFIQSGSLDGIWYWDLENPENEWMSSKFWETLGYNPNEKKHLASEWQGIIFEEDLKLALQNFEKHCADPNYPYDQIVRYKHKNATNVWIRCRGMAIRDENGKAVRMLGAHTDITDLKESEHKISRLTEEYERVFNGTQDAMFLIRVLYTGQFRYIRNNLAHQNKTAISLEQIRNKSPQELVGKEMGDVIAKAYQQCVDSGTSITYEEELSLPAGKRFWLTTLTPILEGGGIAYIVGSSTDITEIKKMEDEMIKTDKLESIGILAGGIAHDFNNYLAILLANIDMAKMFGNSNDLPRVMEKLDALSKATLSASDLSNQLFTFSRGGNPNKKVLLLTKLIQENIEFALSGTKVRPGFQLEKDLFMIEGDKGQISQVLGNIVINAVQAMPEGGILEVQAENVNLTADVGKLTIPLAKGFYVKLTITDHGIGIPEKYLNKIFDPFFTTKDEGRGLGLTTSYSIIRKHGGHIDVKSQMGVGTSFIIYLPATTSVYNVEVEKQEVLPGTGKILIMDDEDALLNVMGQSLAVLGYEVAKCRNGEEAIELYTNAQKQNIPYDLVILDLTIPGGMGGKQVVEMLRKLDPGVKAIVASGYSNDSAMAEYRDYGFMGAVQKPFTIEVLSRTVSQIIQNKTPVPIKKSL